MEVVSLNSLSRSDKESLARELGYHVQDGYLYGEDGHPHLDQYTGDHVRVDNMAIVPGSVLVLDNNPISLAEYIVDYENDQG